MTERIIHLNKEIFELVKSGKKKFEIRLGNKDIEEGDTLVIIQRDENGEPTENKLIKKAGLVTKTKELSFWKDEEINKYGFKIIQLE